MRRRKPMLTVRHFASTAPVTEAQPLIPHAHGTMPGARLASMRRPEGKGQPRKKAGMEIMETVSAILAASGQVMAFENIQPPATASKATQAEITATTIHKKRPPFFWKRLTLMLPSPAKNRIELR